MKHDEDRPQVQPHERTGSAAGSQWLLQEAVCAGVQGQQAKCERRLVPGRRRCGKGERGRRGGGGAMSSQRKMRCCA